MGFYGVPKFIEEAWFGYTRDFAPLSQFTKARLETWGVATPEPAVASPTPLTKERVN
jgi:hypothetical protein